ncbi:MAG: glycosyltransferase family 4 protein, partial [Planctomycetota bacterium]|nr:glycosyltransferase family 4 protein [Planctomycetota bacterium]
MKKIAVYLGAAPEWGGSFQYARALVKGLASLPPGTAEVRCYCENPVWRSYLEKFGFAHETTARGKPFLIARLLRSLHKRIRRERFAAFSDANRRISAWRPDLLVSGQPDYFPLPGKCRQIAPIHDLMHIHERGFPEVGSKGEIRKRDGVFSGIVRHCDVILVDSRLGGEHVLSSYPAKAEQIRVLPYSAAESLLLAEPRRPEGVDGSGKFMFYPAQFWEHKNHVRMAEAMAIARRECPDLRCVFTGSTKYGGYRLFRRKCGELGLDGAATVLGYVGEGEISWLYRRARCLFLPTFFGPTNIPPLEAMALGCPVAASRVYAMPEQCGDAAIYFNPLDVREMADVMVRLWRDDELCSESREKGGRRSHEWNEKKMAEMFGEI